MPPVNPELLAYVVVATPVAIEVYGPPEVVPLNILYEVAPEDAVHERLIVPVPQDPAVADSPVGAGGMAADTVTLVQVEQLLASLPSVIAPTNEALLSAQALTEYVPEDGNVYEEEVTVPLAPAVSSALIFTDKVDTVPPPPAAVATWKRLLNDAPVVALPMFEMFEVNVSAVPAVATAGVGAAAVKSGVGQTDGATAEA